jgi:hypothetical protein
VSLKLLTIFEILDFGLYTRVGYGHDTHESVVSVASGLFLVCSSQGGGLMVGSK